MKERVNMIMSKGLKDKVVQAAEKMDISLTAFIVLAIHDFLKKNGG